MPDEEFMSPMVTRVLADLHEVELDEQVLSNARAELMVAVAAATTVTARPPQRHWGRWVAAAAVVAAIVSGVLIVRTFTDTPVAASAAGEVLVKAADQITNVDPVLKPGQFLYSRQIGWHTTGAHSSSGKSYSYLAETTTEIWTPADVKQEWLGRFTTTGQRKWVDGTEAEARANGVDIDHPLTIPDGEVRAPCGDFTAVMEKRKPCENFGGWVGGTTPEFFAKLPTDPRELYDLMRKETAGKGPHPDVEMLVYAQNVLGNAHAPAKARAVFYRALALMPSLRITDKVSVLDDQVGIALGVEGNDKEYNKPVRKEFVVDSATGRYIGSRDWYDGQLTSTNSMRTAVVDGMGKQPS
nr:CU044_5270 family protein [Kibdelosporangium sp. MJ126-NF4]CEL16551.1 putative RNA polymerase sigma (70) factor [Kibdelosporangium sp. MJ126-NF4]CTQ90504.1 putative RNA polymerase sigma (70) factor [Kibdelosporangium sp. MJ126-NF4]